MAEAAIVVCGVPMKARVEAPQEVFVGTRLEARLVLVSATQTSRLHSEWLALLNMVCCQASLVTVEGAVVLPIAAQQESHAEANEVQS